MHDYKQANLRLQVDINPYKKWPLNLSAKAPATSHKWPFDVRRYHKYESAWSLTVVRKILRPTKELTNPGDPFTVAMIKYGCEVGHVPRTISDTVSFFLRKYCSVCFCEVTAGMVNHTTGFCLNILGVYCFMATRPTQGGSRIFFCSKEQVLCDHF